MRSSPLSHLSAHSRLMQDSSVSSSDLSEPERLLFFDRLRLSERERLRFVEVRFEAGRCGEEAPEEDEDELVDEPDSEEDYEESDWEPLSDSLAALL